MWIEVHKNGIRLSRYTYKYVVPPDRVRHPACHCAGFGLNAPTGAWCSLTGKMYTNDTSVQKSQCTCRCVVLPDDQIPVDPKIGKSQCTCRCVVLPDSKTLGITKYTAIVSMHLQVRGAP